MVWRVAAGKGGREVGRGCAQGWCGQRSRYLVLFVQARLADRSMRRMMLLLGT